MRHAVKNAVYEAYLRSIFIILNLLHLEVLIQSKCLHALPLFFCFEIVFVHFYFQTANNKWFPPSWGCLGGDHLCMVKAKTWQSHWEFSCWNKYSACLVLTNIVLSDAYILVCYRLLMLSRMSHSRSWLHFNMGWSTRMLTFHVQIHTRSILLIVQKMWKKILPMISRYANTLSHWILYLHWLYDLDGTWKNIYNLWQLDITVNDSIHRCNCTLDNTGMGNAIANAFICRTHWQPHGWQSSTASLFDLYWISYRKQGTLFLYLIITWTQTY